MSNYETFSEFYRTLLSFRMDIANDTRKRAALEAAISDFNELQILFRQNDSELTPPFYLLSSASSRVNTIFDLSDLDEFIQKQIKPTLSKLIETQKKSLKSSIDKKLTELYLLYTTPEMKQDILSRFLRTEGSDKGFPNTIIYSYLLSLKKNFQKPPAQEVVSKKEENHAEQFLGEEVVSEEEDNCSDTMSTLSEQELLGSMHEAVVALDTVIQQFKPIRHPAGTYDFVASDAQLYQYYINLRNTTSAPYSARIGVRHEIEVSEARKEVLSRFSTSAPELSEDLAKLRI